MCNHNNRGKGKETRTSPNTPPKVSTMATTVRYTNAAGMSAVQRDALLQLIGELYAAGRKTEAKMVATLLWA